MEGTDDSLRFAEKETIVMASTYPIVRLTIGNDSVVFKDEDIIEATVLQEIHPIGIELPASTADVRIHTTDPRFSPFSGGEYYQALVAGLAVDFYEMVDTNEVYVGRFYLDTWKNPTEGEIEFSCIDAIGVLGNLEYDGKFWEEYMPVTEIVTELLSTSNFQFTVDAAIAAKSVKGYLPGNTTIRESLQKVLFAVGAFASTAQSSKINIKQGVIPIPRAIYAGYYYDSGTALYDDAVYSDQIVEAPITDADKSGKQKLDILPLVTGVEVISHDYQRGEVEEEIFNAMLTPGDYKLVYPKPYHTVTGSGVGDSTVYLATAGGAILMPASSTGTYPDVTLFTLNGTFEFEVNYVWLHVLPPGGNVIIKGKPYLDGTRSFYYANPDAVKDYSAGFVYDDAESLYDNATYLREWSVSAPPNVWKIDKDTLIQADTSPAVLDRVVEYANLRYLHRVKLFPLLGIEPGEVKIVDSLYDKDQVEVIERISSDLTGGYLMDTELVGVEREIV